MIDDEIRPNLRFNFWVNLIDGGFFGLALGFSSFHVIVPLFINTLTESAILIGIIPALHSVGWQLPQILTAHRVRRLDRFKPMVLGMTIHERWPFFGLAIVAWLIPILDRNLVLVLSFILLAWQGLGGGLTATAWQSMVGKIIIPKRHGIFFGLQSAAGHLLSSAGAIIAGILLEVYPEREGYSLIFLFAGIAMTISMGFLSLTREPSLPLTDQATDQMRFWGKVVDVLRGDPNFRWFVAARILSQFALMATVFYAVFAVRVHGLSAAQAGQLGGVLSIASIIANPVLGWIGDRWGYRVSMAISAMAATMSGFGAWFAPSGLWFYPVFALAGVATVGFWTTVIAMNLRFGSPDEKPIYIGLANSLIAPGTLIAPLLGGWLADTVGYTTSFLVSGISGAIAFLIIVTMVREPAAQVPVNRASPSGR